MQILFKQNKYICFPWILLGKNNTSSLDARTWKIKCDFVWIVMKINQINGSLTKANLREMLCFSDAFLYQFASGL